MSSDASNYTIRLPNKVKDRLQEIADAEHRSLSNLINKTLAEYLEKAAE